MCLRGRGGAESVRRGNEFLPNFPWVVGMGGPAGGWISEPHDKCITRRPGISKLSARNEVTPADPDPAWFRPFSAHGIVNSITKSPKNQMLMRISYAETPTHSETESLLTRTRTLTQTYEFINTDASKVYRRAWTQVRSTRTET